MPTSSPTCEINASRRRCPCPQGIYSVLGETEDKLTGNDNTDFRVTEISREWGVTLESLGGALFLTGRNSKDFQKEAKSEVHPKNHAVRGMAAGCVPAESRICSRIKELEKKVSFPQNSKCFPLTETGPARRGMVGRKPVKPKGRRRGEESSSDTLQDPNAPQFKNNCWLKICSVKLFSSLLCLSESTGWFRNFSRNSQVAYLQSVLVVRQTHFSNWNTQSCVIVKTENFMESLFSLQVSSGCG